VSSETRGVTRVLDAQQDYLRSIGDDIVAAVKEGLKEGGTSGAKKGAWEGLKEECLPQGLMNIEGVAIEDIARPILRMAISGDIRQAIGPAIKSGVGAYLDGVVAGVGEMAPGLKPGTNTVIRLVMQRHEAVGDWIEERLPTNPLSKGIATGIQTAINEGLESGIEELRQRIEGTAEERGEGERREERLQQARQIIKSSVKDAVKKVADEVAYEIARQITKRVINALKRKLKPRHLEKLEDVLRRLTEQEFEKGINRAAERFGEELIRSHVDEMSLVNSVDKNFGGGLQSHLSSLVPRFPVVPAVLGGAVIIIAVAIVFYMLPQNELPEALASIEEIEGLTVRFYGDDSQDPDGRIVAYLWDFGDGAESRERNPVHEYARAGNYVVTLTVTDDAEAEDEVTIRTGPLAGIAPVARASILRQERMTFFFTSGGSSDPDGHIVAYHWDFGDGTEAESPNPEHSYREPGDYTVTLTVTDNHGERDRDTVFIGGMFARPVASASVIEVVGLRVIFTGVESRYADGRIVAYHWEFGDGATAGGPEVGHVYPKDGDYRVTLTVEGDDGTVAEDTISTGMLVNEPPIAEISFEYREGEALYTYAFSSKGSHDPDGEIVAYHWDFGDGTFSEEPNPEHRFGKAAYDVVLTVTDDRGVQRRAQVTIGPHLE
jgi:PKD repeat protein